MNIFVGNLANDVVEQDLNDLFTKYGKVNEVKIIRDMFSQQSKGFGFIEMPSNSEAQTAMKELNTFELKGKKLTVNEARPRNDRNSGRRNSNRGRTRR
jgi:RNA recognition motif-containing protein